MTPDTIVNDFRDALLGAGLTPPDHIEADGKVHRFSTNGKRSDAAGWYCLHLDGLPAGIFGDWRQGLTVTWCSKSDEAMTPAERAAMRETIRALLVQRQADQQRRQEQAKASAMQAWEAAGDCTGHPYLQRKGVHGYGLRQYGGLLMIPLRDTSGTLHSIQTITPDGDKRFQAGGRVRGCYHAIGGRPAREATIPGASRVRSPDGLATRSRPTPPSPPGRLHVADSACSGLRQPSLQRAHAIWRGTAPCRP